MPADTRRTSLPFATVVVIALLPACATLGRDDLVWIDVGGDNNCVIDVEGRRFVLPGSETGLAAHLGRLADRTGGAVMGPRPARTSPGCWDAAMALARDAGFARLGYVSDAPRPAGVVG